MIEAAIKSGDPFISILQRKLGAVPETATKKSIMKKKESYTNNQFSCDWLWTNCLWFKR